MFRRLHPALEGDRTPGGAGGGGGGEGGVGKGCVRGSEKQAHTSHTGSFEAVLGGCQLYPARECE